MKHSLPLSFLILATPFLCPAVAAEPPPAEVVLLDHVKVGDAFAKGMPLLLDRRFKVQAGRRVVAGAVEIHANDTDIFYVTEGSATFVTGGTAVDPKPMAVGEIRAKEITGGVVHHLTKGDVIVIPSGIPHQFTEVAGTFLYFVVKVSK
ncbi:MAG: hypothetical protein JWM88_1203 [Verrucomicrobia bacterium]|nr:hypothetical protein [Verrucomicrobiota bacterium]